MAADAVIEAAVGILQQANGDVLLGQRPPGKPWAGWWEFPGGKIEAGETPIQALSRELHEELGIEVVTASRWLTRTFDYPERRVKLHFFIVREWRQQPLGREGQQLAWQDPQKLTVGPMLPANEPILAALALPPVYAITNLAETASDFMNAQAVFLAQLETCLQQGLRLIQLREKQLTQAELADFSAKLIPLAHSYGAKVLINADIALAYAVGADGVHFTSSQLPELSTRPANLIVAASCHSALELLQAQRLALDFVVLGPVMPTLSHPGSAVLGWAGFRKMTEDCTLPIYALGGMQPDSLEHAWQQGAHGIAMQRAVWS